MSDGGIFSVSKEELEKTSDQESFENTNSVDFVQIFPPELSNTLFTYVPEKDLFSCSKCSLSWQQVINNDSQWKLRCVRRGWATETSGLEIVKKWTEKKSHVGKSVAYKFRTSPVFNLPELASLRVSPLCDWAVYFRQCFHIRRNWDKGIYVIHRLAELKCSEYDFLTLNNDFDCNEKLLVSGTSAGKIFIWSVEGVPAFLTCINSRRRIEVESVKLSSKSLVILYQSGLIKVFDTQNLLKPLLEDQKEPLLTLVYQIKATGTQSADGFEFNLNVEYIDAEDNNNSILDEDEDDVELWIRDLFRVDLWMGNEYHGSDMMIYVNDNLVILTGILCKCFFIWNVENGKSIRQIPLQLGYQVIYQGYLSPRNMYVSVKKRQEGENEPPHAYAVHVYNISALEKNCPETEIKPIFIPSESIVEEIRSDSKDKRIAYTTQDGEISGVSLQSNEVEKLFTINAPSFVDNLTVTDSLIVYHQYDGFLVGINWAGDPLYQIEAHIGLVKGLQICNDRLISGGDAMQLCVWDSKTGTKLHTVHHQPCRIQRIFADSTKIVTVGREDNPVVVAFW